MGNQVTENKYEAYSSDDLQNQKSYDIQPEVNLQKKLGLEVE